MSTNADTERCPQRASRSTIQPGVRAVGSMPRTMRPLKRPHRSVACTWIGSVSWWPSGAGSMLARGRLPVDVAGSDLPDPDLLAGDDEQPGPDTSAGAPT